MPQIDPHAAEAFALEVVRRLREAGYESYWAGGCVRDRLLGLTPKDYDVATSATPAEIQRAIKRKTIAIGAAFGVITVLGPRPAGQVEVATFRQDASYSDGRHPDSVRFTNAREDARRRDFTMNGLFFDPLSQEVIDYVDGRRDLEQQLIRAIGDPEQRFAEDKLRMLRAIRFAATFGFAIESATFSAIQKNAAEIRAVSAERISGELRAMLSHVGRGDAVRLLRESGLLTAIFPEALPWQTVSPEPPRFAETVAIMSTGTPMPFPVAAAALLRGITAAKDEPTKVAAKICRRGKFSNQETETILVCLANEDAVCSAHQRPWHEIQPLLVHRCAPSLVAYAESVVQGLGAPTDGVDYCRERLAWPGEKLDPTPLIRGDDLQAAGITPGPIYATILQRVREAQLEGQIADRTAAMELANAIEKQESHHEA